jgi:hypothetical protein
MFIGSDASEGTRVITSDKKVQLKQFEPKDEVTFSDGLRVKEYKLHILFDGFSSFFGTLLTSSMLCVGLLLTELQDSILYTADHSGRAV